MHPIASLQMSHVAWSVSQCVCVFVCLCAVLGTRVSCAKTAEPIEMPFGADLCWSKETCIRLNIRQCLQ